MTPRNANTKRILATLGVVGAVGALAAGTYSQFTGSTSVTQNISSGTLVLDGTNNSLTIDATDIAPGDTIQRGIDVQSTGTVGLSGISLATTLAPAAPTTSPADLLTSDSVNGLQMRVDSCTAMPTLQVDGSYDCPGMDPDPALSWGPILRADTALDLPSVGASNFLRVTVTLPTSADDTFQAKSTSVLYTFNGVQRAGTFK